MKRSLTQRSLSILLILSFASLLIATACQGSDGSIGPVGSKGDAGPAGLAGHDGGTGPQGPQGDAGPRGSEGASGSQGARGDTAVATVASLTVSSSTAKCTRSPACGTGEAFSLNGSGFAPGGAYTAVLSVGGQELSFVHIDTGSLVINNNGAFNSEWRFTSAAPAGVYTLIVTDEQGIKATAPFVIS